MNSLEKWDEEERADIRKRLVAARKLIKNPKRWCTKRSAENNKGHKCFPTSEDAVRWCATGAVIRVCEEKHRLTEKCLDHLREIIRGTACYFPQGTVPNFNDRMGHERVINIFDRAIAAIDASYFINPSTIEKIKKKGGSQGSSRGFGALREEGSQNGTVGNATKGDIAL